MNVAQRRGFTVIFLIGLALIGIGTKLYRGPLETWFHNYAGGVVYEVFWIALFRGLLPRARLWRVALSVFLVTCGLEALQLYHSPFLEGVRSTFLGRALIGHGFDPWDFFYYAVGSLIGWGVCLLATRAMRR